MQAQPQKIRAILIDPFKQALVKVMLPPDDLEQTKKLLDCTWLDVVNLAPTFPAHVLWVDESGLLRAPFVYPQFRLLAYAKGQYPLAGYGLVTGTTKEGEMTDCQISPKQLAANEFGFEDWKQRIDPDKVIEQLLRIYP